MGALSATWQKKYQAPFEPLVPGFRMGIFNDIENIPNIITSRTCGVIVEPIQVRPFPPHDVDIANEETKGRRWNSRSDGAFPSCSTSALRRGRGVTHL